MTVNRTTLLDLPLPVTGTESGTWGDTTNNGLTQYMDIAIAGMSNLTSANFTAGALTIETTEGDSSATNISATSAQYAGFRVSSLAVNSTITVGNTGTSPARSYRLINADATYSLTFKATGQTGVTLLPGQSAVVAFNGTDYVIVGVVGAGSTTDNTVPRFDGTTGKILQSSGITIDDSNNVSGVAQLNITTLDATNIEVTNIKAKDGTAAASIADSTGVISVTANPVLSGGTANGVLYLNGSKVATSGSALTFDGTRLAVNGGANGSQFSVKGTSAFVGFDTGAANDGRIEFAYNGTKIFEQEITSSSLMTLKAVSGVSLSFGANNTEQMRLTSTGLGIGTSSPSTKLQVNGNVYLGGAARNIYADNGSGIFFNGLNNFGSGIYSDGSGTALKFQTSSTDRMTLDSSGNLGLGVTPSAWGSAWKAAEFGDGAMLGSSGTGLIGNALTANAYITSGGGSSTSAAYKYNDYASMYKQYAGRHEWYNAPSGTAGNAITFTQAMTLDASGRLGLGITSPSYTQQIQSATTSSGATPAFNLVINRQNSATEGLFLGMDGNTDAVIAANNSALRFGTVVTGAYTERARITSGGDLGIGTTSPIALGAGYTSVTVNGSTSGRFDVLFNGTHYGAFQADSGGAKVLAQGASNPLVLGTNNLERARITSGGNFKIGGTADRGTTEGDKQLVLFNGTAPVGTLTNGISLYSSSGEAYVMDAAGNATLFSPHDRDTNEWIFRSKHTPSGKVLKIDVERLLRFINDHFGLDAVQEFIEP